MSRKQIPCLEDKEFILKIFIISRLESNLLITSIFILISGPVESAELVVEVTEELHRQDVLLALLQLLFQLRDVELAIMVVLVPLYPYAWARLFSRGRHLGRGQSEFIELNTSNEFIFSLLCCVCSIFTPP